jgi:hypothetical protein
MVVTGVLFAVRFLLVLLLFGGTLSCAGRYSNVGSDGEFDVVFAGGGRVAGAFDASGCDALANAVAAKCQ